jgi:Holliday junction resolvasome RuvABC endonuclease subunit
MNPPVLFPYPKGTVIAGIDLSLNATGIVILDSSGTILHQELIENIVLTKGIYKNGNERIIKTSVFGMERLKLIRNRIHQLLLDYQVQVVGIEGYAMGIFGIRGKGVVGRIFNLGEVGGCVRLSIHELGLKSFEISPNSLKAFVTGNGAADKEMMIESTEKRFGIKFEDDNVCDAYGLARFVFTFGDNTPVYSAKGGSKKIRSLKL